MRGLAFRWPPLCQALQILALVVGLCALGACATYLPSPPPPMPIREFRLPAPLPSARYTIPRTQFAGATNLAMVDARLRVALARRRYTQPTYLRVQDGFAMVAQMERIEDSGASWPNQSERWNTGPARLVAADAGMWEQLLWAVTGSGRSDAGRYRVIVFLVTTADVETTRMPPTPSEAEAWMDDGAHRLPHALGAAPFSPNHDVIALIYDFRRPAVQDSMIILRPSPLRGDQHLVRAGLLPL